LFRPLVSARVLWKARWEGHGVKNTEKAEQAASGIESFGLFPGFLESGRSRKAAEILSTRPWALLGGTFGAGFGIRKVAIPQECLKNRDASDVLW
ncbi:MAG: hypothetical protein D084_Lepto4C00448G0001, partial [Leptospirillum sp. Group IV 'UBA BS']